MNEENEMNVEEKIFWLNNIVRDLILELEEDLIKLWKDYCLFRGWVEELEELRKKRWS